MNARNGYADVLVGLQYGDEGKAKVVDRLAAGYDIIARFNGGANAGHTVDTPQGRARLAQVPSGVFHPEVLLYIGSGCVVSLIKLAEEIESLRRIGARIAGRLHLSELCPVIQPAHLDFDVAHGAGIGTTGNGIGPCYAGLSSRWEHGTRAVVQIRDLVADEESAFAQMAHYASLHANAPSAQAATVSRIADMRAAWQAIRDTVDIVDSLWMTTSVKRGARVLFEGAQSVMLDVTAGQQPFVTSSHTVPAFAYVGGDLSHRYHRKTIGVAKAIASRVGAGPFRAEFGGERSSRYCADAALRGIGWREERDRFEPGEMLGSEDAFDVGVALRMLTGEYGTGSGRPRRLGRLDVAALAEVVERHGIDEIYLNKCDCLAWFARTRAGTIPVLIGPAGDDGGEPVIRDFPAFGALADNVPDFASLPAPLRQFVLALQEAAGCRIAGIGIGPQRDQLLTLSEEDVRHGT